MIIDFTFGNFRSFKNNSNLSLVAATKLRADEELDTANVFAIPNYPHLSLLHVAAIYGANASGKSNIIDALDAFQRTVIHSADAEFSLNETPFAYNPSSLNTPLFFEMSFLIASIHYRYGFEINPGPEGEIVSEWLYRATSSKETVLFERKGDEVERKRAFTDGAALLDKIEGTTEKRRVRRKSALFLSLCAQVGGQISSSIVNFVRIKIRIISGLKDTLLRKYTEKCLEGGLYRDIIVNMVKAADTGIIDIEILDEEKAIESFQSDKPVEEELSESSKQQIIKNFRVQSVHPVFNDAGNQVDTIRGSVYVLESQGTRKLIAFAGPIADTLTKGYTLIVDELDVKWHPLLTKAVISLFQSPKTNPNNAQLIFVTHDTNLLDKRNLRRDQIWFVEKDRFGISHLYSLAEFKGVRKQQGVLEDEYIAGRYGAIPFLGGWNKLFDSAESSTNVVEATTHDRP